MASCKFIKRLLYKHTEYEFYGYYIEEFKLKVKEFLKSHNIEDINYNFIHFYGEILMLIDDIFNDDLQIVSNLRVSECVKSYRKKYSHRILSLSHLLEIYNFIYPYSILEVACGKGFFSFCMRSLGIATITTDMKLEENSFLDDIVLMDGFNAVNLFLNPDMYLVMIQPQFGKIAFDLNENGSLNPKEKEVAEDWTIRTLKLAAEKGSKGFIYIGYFGSYRDASFLEFKDYIDTLDKDKLTFIDISNINIGETFMIFYKF